MSEATYQHTRILMDSSAVVNVPPVRFRQLLEYVHSSIHSLDVPGSFNASMRKNIEEDQKRPLRFFGQNYTTLMEFVEKGLLLNNAELLKSTEDSDSAFSDIRTAASELARECAHKEQRPLLITADTTLVMQITLLGIKIDILRFSADAATPNAEALINIEDMDQAAEAMRYPWEDGKPHHQQDPCPAADVTQPRLDLFIEGESTPIRLHQQPNQAGAEAVLYRCDAHPDHIAKVFRSETGGHPLDHGKLNNVLHLMITQQHNDVRYAILPDKKLCDAQGNVVGYLMKYVKNFESFSKLRFHNVTNLDVQISEAIAFCIDVVWQLLHLADFGIQIYDFGKNNLGIDKDTNELVTLDSDSFLKGNYLPYSATNYFKQPKLAYNHTTRSEAIAECTKSAYLFVTYILLGKPPLDDQQHLNPSWDTYSYRIPASLEPFLKKVVQMDPEEVPYLDALLEKLDVVLQAPEYQDCTYRQLRDAAHSHASPPPRKKRSPYNPWENVVRTPDVDPNEPVLLIPRGVFTLCPAVKPAAHILGWSAPKVPEKTASRHAVGVRVPIRYPPEKPEPDNSHEQQKKRRRRRLRLLLIVLVLMMLFVVDISLLQQIPTLIAKLRDACSTICERILGPLWEHPMNPIPGWLESIRSVFIP